MQELSLAVSSQGSTVMTQLSNTRTYRGVATKHSDHNSTLFAVTVIETPSSNWRYYL